MNNLKQNAKILVEQYKFENKGKKLNHKEMEKYLSKVLNILEKKPNLAKKKIGEGFKSKYTFLNDKKLRKEIVRNILKIDEQFYDYLKQIIEENSKQKEIEISEELENSLNPWLEYILSKDALYSPSSKYWIKEGLASFDGRSKTSIKPFPKLNQQALAKVVDIFENKNSGKEIENEIGLKKEEFEKIKKKKNLSKKDFTILYNASLKSLPDSMESNLEITEGVWKKYPKDIDMETKSAEQIVKDIKNYNTTWCTAGLDMARRHLSFGDFYVYFSKNSQTGKNEIPRLAIRMDGEKISEIRGVGENQGIDDFISKTDILKNKMIEEFGEGAFKLYEKKVFDDKKLTEIFENYFEIIRKKGKESFIWKNPEIKDEDLDFLFSEIETFALGQDPRLFKIIKKFIEIGVENIPEKYHKDFGFKLLNFGGGRYLAENIKKFTGIKENENKEIAFKIVEVGCGEYLMENFESFVGIKPEDHKKLAINFMNTFSESTLMENFEKLTGIKEKDHEEIILSCLESGDFETMILNIDKFTGVKGKSLEKIIKFFIDEGYAFLVDINFHKFKNRGLSEDFLENFL